MMDFARKQLEKYGWTDGKGLGKFENGIAQALKPKLKRSVAGVGHDAASDFTEHWWAQLYDKAAGNLLVEEKNGKTKKIKVHDETNFEITNSIWKLNKRSKKVDEKLYVNNFVKTAVLTNGGSNIEKLVESESEDEMKESKYATKMTDEELFAACEGRTAHKGARHGLRALGKLARIEKQEKMLLTLPKYKGYSHANNINKSDEQIEQLSLNSDNECSEVPKKKKKRKQSIARQNIALFDNEEIHQNDLEMGETIETISKKKKKKNSKEKHTGEENEKNMDYEEIAESEFNCRKSRKSKKSKSQISNKIFNDNIDEQVHIIEPFVDSKYSKNELNVIENDNSKKLKRPKKGMNKNQFENEITSKSKRSKKSKNKMHNEESIEEEIKT